jgi:putative tricarboxylic transport membrane protein
MMWEGFQIALSSYNLLYLLFGTVVGLVVGALPALGPMFSVSLMLPLTYGMPPATAIIFLASIQAATAYGDSIASILINTPGGGGSIPACWDGYPMTQQGKSGMALGISAFSSFFGGFMGWVAMVLISPILVYAALRIGPPEMFMIMLIALSLLAVAAKGNTIKGMILACLGLLFSFVGMDQMTGSVRFTWGSLYLEDGLPLIPVVVGLFALSQTIKLAEEGGTIARVAKLTGGAWSGFMAALRRPVTLIRSGLVGVWLGVLPALGISSASIVAYLVEKRASREPESFGKGNPTGLVAPEVAKNACVVGDLIPTFTLGIPGSPTTAIFLAAMVLHGLKPGADFFSKGPLPYTVFAGILLSQFAFFIVGMLVIRWLARIVLIPNSLLVPGIIILTFVGAYAVRYRMTDVLIMVFFGIVGYLIQKFDYPPACLVLGFVLGDLVESNFQRTEMMYDSIFIIFQRPIALGLFIAMVISLSWPWIGPILKRRMKGKGKGRARA